MSTYHIWTSGCQMNAADSRHLSEELERRGFKPAPSLELASIVIVNSCVVRQSAENRALSKLASLKSLKETNPDRKIALTGCLVANETTELEKRFPYVDYFFGPQDFEGFLRQTVPPPVTKIATPSSSNGEQQVIAQVNVIQGCNHQCTFCIVPYRRGKEKSRPMADIQKEAEQLVDKGVRELVLLGQNVDKYGYDLPDKPDLADLLQELSRIPGLHRLRFLTSHPLFMREKIIRAVSQLEKACEHINIPVQAGDDGVLHRMKRGYTSIQYRQLVTKIREEIPHVALSTDIIVGFPGEGEEQFEKTRRLVEELRFDKVHIAAFSPRAGTPAAQMVDDVPMAEKRRRQRLIEELQKKTVSEINAKLVGKAAEVLVDRKRDGQWGGRTRTNKLVFFPHSEYIKGRLVWVHIEESSPWYLRGRLVKTNP